MNFHKSIPMLANKIKNAQNKKEANEIIRKVLKSYKIQTQQEEYCISDQELDAFENSILNPSLDFKTDVKEERLLLKKSKSKKFMFLFKYEELIKIFRSNGASMQKIASYFNSHRTPKKGRVRILINKMDISRYCKERGIS
jgi:hypothetical protein